MRTHNAHQGVVKQAEVRFKSGDLRGAGELNTRPTWTVVHPLVRDNILASNAQPCNEVIEFGIGQRAAADSVRSLEKVLVVDCADLHKPSTALLNNAISGVLRVLFMPRVCRTKRGVPGKRNFTIRRENTQCVVGLRRGSGRNERGFRQVCPARNTLHLLAG